MARSLLLLTFCILLVLVSAIHPTRNPIEIKGHVFYDTCHAVECRDRKTMDLVYNKEGTIDSYHTSATVTSFSKPNCFTPIIKQKKKILFLKKLKFTPRFAHINAKVKLGNQSKKVMK
ncbi:hypothetical protein P3X46_007079 [Hevea brasiliensis]|uniref:Uncharacterized protein n=1 Tax=Hevea brasiliensis TaxID=3981 RepID=A0ABQ9MUT2_HEVBR|nr:hypothetical protein P3X46_007079 [Hevea brasiliensis]